MFGRRQYWIFHVQPTVVCSNAPHRIELISYIGFRPPVLYLARVLVQHAAAAWVGKAYNQVVTVDIEHICSIGKAVLQKALRK